MGKALIACKAEQSDPFAAIEAILPWEAFTASVEQADQLSRDEAFDALELITDYFSTLRKYAPSFLEMFEFRGAPVTRPLLEALDVLRTMNRTGARKVPVGAPLAFVPPRWARSIGTGENIDRRFYEFCALSELKNRLRAGDLYVPGSRQFRDFDDICCHSWPFARCRMRGGSEYRCRRRRRPISPIVLKRCGAPWTRPTG